MERFYNRPLGLVDDMHLGDPAGFYNHSKPIDFGPGRVLAVAAVAALAFGCGKIWLGRGR